MIEVVGDYPHNLFFIHFEKWEIGICKGDSINFLERYCARERILTPELVEEDDLF